MTERASPNCWVSSGGHSGVGCRSECNQRGEAESQSTTTESSVKSSSGNAVRSGHDGSKFSDFEGRGLHRKIMLYVLIPFSRRSGWTVPTFCEMLIFDLQFLGHIYLAAERSVHTELTYGLNHSGFFARRVGTMNPTGQKHSPDLLDLFYESLWVRAHRKHADERDLYIKTWL